MDEIYSDRAIRFGIGLGLVELKGNARPWWMYVLYKVSFQLMNVSVNLSGEDSLKLALLNQVSIKKQPFFPINDDKCLVVYFIINTHFTLHALPLRSEGTATLLYKACALC